jgi:hypothetical protein
MELLGGGVWMDDVLEIDELAVSARHPLLALSSQTWSGGQTLHAVPRVHATEGRSQQIASRT